MFRSETMPEGVTPYSAMFQPTCGGHRFFVCRKKINGALGLAVADDSGELPEHTDDGVLFIDRYRSMVFRNDSPKAYILLPVCSPDDTGLRTCAVTPRDAMFVSGMLGMPLPTIYQEVQW
jgi:hypothetical protein